MDSKQPTVLPKEDHSFVSLCSESSKV